MQSPKLEPWEPMFVFPRQSEESPLRHLSVLYGWGQCKGDKKENCSGFTPLTGARFVQWERELVFVFAA